MTIGQRIKSIRQAKGIRLCDIQKSTGIAPGTVANWENENSIPRVYLLYQVAKLLGVSLDTIAGRTQRQKQIKDYKASTTGQIISREMEKRGYTPSRLAKETGIWVTTIYHYRNDRREPHLLLLCSIADLFDMRLDDFIPEEWDNEDE